MSDKGLKRKLVVWIGILLITLLGIIYVAFSNVPAGYGGARWESQESLEGPLGQEAGAEAEKPEPGNGSGENKPKPEKEPGEKKEEPEKGPGAKKPEPEKGPGVKKPGLVQT